MTEDVIHDDAILEGTHSSQSVAEKISGLIFRKTPWGWMLGFSLGFMLVMLLMIGITYLLAVGVGIWGINIPVAWGFAITNFVWWIGIGHAGTFISAFLLLLRREWRTSINRFAEAMTIFAVACAGLFPLLHLGRPWFFYWLIPYPNVMELWPQFRSPLVWDFFAVLTYFTVSLVFWYLGLIPDFAVLRDRSEGRRRKLFNFMSLGWRGAATHWARYSKAYLLLAGLAAPLVISVHSIVSLDFSFAIVPGWHSTIFPPYFVAGAIFSGFAMVLTLGIPLRCYFRLQEMITMHHLEACAKLMLATGMIVAFSYASEAFNAWYSGDTYEWYVTLNRALGPYLVIYWISIACNVFVPQALWFRKVRRNVALLFIISLLVNVGMWSERFVIVITSLHRDFLPSSWGMFYPTFWDWAILFGSVGLFVFLFYLFIRWLPVISISEMQELADKESRQEKKG